MIINIYIHPLTYIFLLITFLSGYFEFAYLLLIIILIHECGHYVIGKILNLKTDKIIIYPFGGITLYNEKLNVSIIKEFFCLLGGITFQILFFLLIKKLYNYGFVTFHVFNIIRKINFMLISFNFMPILPLDGGRLLNLIFDIIFPYKYSHIISNIISIIFSIIFIINFSIFRLIIFIFLIKNIYYEIHNINIKYNKFLLERYLYNFNFKNIRIIKNENNFKRNYSHIINNMFEKDYLKNKFS